MNNRNPFIRKIIYIACIGGLLIPLAMVSRPETRNEIGEIKDAGGVLSALRDKHNLSQAKMSEIDPASETMKLASLGLRGVAVNMLWMQAMEHSKNENYDQLASTLQTLTKVQPNFVKVWEYQAHNLAYNVSMEFDDYEYRYSWVKKGLAFLKRGIPYNKRDHRVPSKLGFFTGNKFGKSDESLSFRRMFRKDDEFHRKMSDFLNPDDYDQVGYGHDTWKMAYQWYDLSRKMVEEQSCPQREGDMLFYMYRPAQIRHQALSLQDEFRSEEILMEIWRRADEEWQEYGKEEISNTLGLVVSMESMAKYESDIDVQRKILDTMAPEGTRAEMMKDLMQQADLTEDQKAVMQLAPDERTDEQNVLARRITDFLSNMAGNIDRAIALEAPEENATDAEKAVLRIVELQNQILTIDKNSNTINYRYWRARNKAESSELTISARQALYDAKQMWRQSIYDDEYDFDYKTKKKTVTKQGAISLYLSAFSKWQSVFDEYPELTDGLLADQLKESVDTYYDMLKVTNREWPENFPMQQFVDFRSKNGFVGTVLPTTESLEELQSGRSSDSKGGSSEDEIGAEPAKSESKSDDAEGGSDEASDKNDAENEKAKTEKS